MKIRFFAAVSAFVTLGTVTYSQQVFAFPFPPKNVPAQSAGDFLGIEKANFDFEGIVALNNCSGSLIRLKQHLDTDKAWVLTNGHCYEGGFLENGKTLLNKASDRSFSVLDRNGEKRLGTVKATRALYATMTNSDMTIYELQSSFQDIEDKFNTKAFVLADQKPLAGTGIEVISGYWKRGYACSIQSFVPLLKEGTWLFKDSIKYLQPGCETIGGTSGSPIVNAANREVVGVNNTGNEDGQKCTVNNPCEVDASGKVTFEKGAAYGQQTFQIYGCIDQDRKLDVKMQGCQLFVGK
jgi:V8-like Glu-specific endopeptidase